MIFPYCALLVCCFCFFNDTATTELYTLSLHDALPILAGQRPRVALGVAERRDHGSQDDRGQEAAVDAGRSEEHTSELQSLTNLVCRLLLEKKKAKKWCLAGRHCPRC